MHALMALPVVLIALPVLMNAYALPLGGFTRYCGRKGVGPRQWAKLLFLVNPPITLRGIRITLSSSILGAIVALWAIRSGNFRGLFSLSDDDCPAPAGEILASWQFDCVTAAIVTAEILVAWGLVGILCYSCIVALA
jgi:hypothetical protein